MVLLLQQALNGHRLAEQCSAVFVAGIMEGKRKQNLSRK